MPNPKFITNTDSENGTGEPTNELLKRIALAKDMYYTHLWSFCKRYGYDIHDMSHTEDVFFSGSNAGNYLDKKRESDVDLVLINPAAPSSGLYLYKRKILDPRLNEGKTRSDWIDIWFAADANDLKIPKWNVTDYWIGL